MAAANKTDDDKTKAEAAKKAEAANQSKAEEVAELKGRLTELTGENKKLAAENKALSSKLEAAQTEISSARAKLESRGASALGDLGKGSYELKKSVTIADRDGTRILPRRGDVVTTLDDTDELVAAVGVKARIFRVSTETVKELQKSDLVRL